MATGDHVGKFYGPGLEVAYNSSPHILFLSVLKTEQSTRCLTTENPNHFSLVSLTLNYLFCILHFIAKIHEQE